MRLRRLTARWARLAAAGDLPCARSSHGLSAIAGKAYLFGGEEKARHAIDSAVHKLDPKDGGHWTRLEPEGAAPSPRIGHAQCSTRDSLLVFGGRTGVALGEGDLNDLWCFTADGLWTKLEAADGAPPSPRSFHRAVTVGERVYVFGGCGGEGRLADLHEFDLTTRRWTALPPADIAGRGGATFEASADGRRLLLCCGFAGHETDDVLSFDLAARAWSRHPSDWLRPRSVCASWSFDLPAGPATLLFGGEVEPSDIGHAGAGGFERDLVAIDSASGEPLELVLDDAGSGEPRARGWASAAALSAETGVLFGGLAGSDDAPERLDDAWTLTVTEER